MHKIILILLSFVIPITAKTQDTIKIPTSIAKQMVKDFVSCDSAKAVLQIAKDELLLTEQKVILKDVVISNYVMKDSMYEHIILNEQQKFSLQNTYVKRLEKDNKKLRTKLTLWKVSFSLGVAGTVFAYFYLTR
jgi:hypothetical protein